MGRLIKLNALRSLRPGMNVSAVVSAEGMPLSLSFFNGRDALLEITPDGLQIQIVDDQKRPMFDSGSASVKPYMREILKEIGIALLDVENKISLDGHTDQSSYANAARGYSNWELSADRANASRRELAVAGMPEDKLARVVGMASSLLLDPQDPLNPSNRRISILVMTKEAEERLLGGPRTPVELEIETESPQPTTSGKSQP